MLTNRLVLRFASDSFWKTWRSPSSCSITLTSISHRLGHSCCSSFGVCAHRRGHWIAMFLFLAIVRAQDIGRSPRNPHSLNIGGLKHVGWSEPMLMHIMPFVRAHKGLVRLPFSSQGSYDLGANLVLLIAWSDVKHIISHRLIDGFTFNLHFPFVFVNDCVSGLVVSHWWNLIGSWILSVKERVPLFPCDPFESRVVSFSVQVQ